MQENQMKVLYQGWADSLSLTMLLVSKLSWDSDCGFPSEYSQKFFTL